MKGTLLQNIFQKKRHIIWYGFFAAILIFTLKWLQWKFLIVDNSLEIYIGLIAVFFTVLGVWVATRLVKPKVQKVVVEKEVYVSQPEDFTINEVELEKLNLSDREYEVLQLLAKGYSNAEIADALFLSISTIKTHVSNLLLKMDVENRTHAAAKAKKLRIVE
jgi:DNA-binding CsgD family transcriptional regulator